MKIPVNTFQLLAMQYYTIQQYQDRLFLTHYTATVTTDILVERKKYFEAHKKNSTWQF